MTATEAINDRIERDILAQHERATAKLRALREERRESLDMDRLEASLSDLYRTLNQLEEEVPTLGIVDLELVANAPLSVDQVVAFQAVVERGLSARVREAQAHLDRALDAAAHPFGGIPRLRAEPPGGDEPPGD